MTLLVFRQDLGPIPHAAKLVGPGQRRQFAPRRLPVLSHPQLHQVMPRAPRFGRSHLQRPRPVQRGVHRFAEVLADKAVQAGVHQDRQDLGQRRFVITAGAVGVPAAQRQQARSLADRLGQQFQVARSSEGRVGGAERGRVEIAQDVDFERAGFEVAGQVGRPASSIAGVQRQQADIDIGRGRQGSP